MKKQNVVLKAGVGLVLGVGAMVFAPRMAMASVPCSGPQDWTNCPTVDPQIVVTGTSDVTTSYGCYDTNCDHVNDHTFKIEHTHRDFWYYPPNGGTAPGDPVLTEVVCDSYHYTKEGKC